MLDEYAVVFPVLKPRRKLQWLPTLGNVEVEIELADRTVTFTVSPPHAAVIALFHDNRTAVQPRPSGSVVPR